MARNRHEIILDDEVAGAVAEHAVRFGLTFDEAAAVLIWSAANPKPAAKPAAKKPVKKTVKK